MTRYSIAAVQVQVIDVRSTQPLHVSNFSRQALDLLEVWGDFLTELQSTGGHRTMDRHLMPATHNPAGARTWMCEFDYGHHGFDRRVRDAASGQQTGAVAAGEVAASPLRSLLRVPSNGLHALLAIECVGTASAAGMVCSALKTHVQRRRAGVRLETRFVEEVDAWENFLNGADLKEVEFLYRRAPRNNRAGRPVTESYGIKAGRGEMLPRDWISQLRRQRMQAGDVLTVQVPDGDADETVLVVEGDGQRRTVRLNAGLPQFTWQVGDDNQRPSDGVFYEMAEQVLAEELQRLEADPSEA